MAPYRFSVITIFPELFKPFCKTGVFGRGVSNRLLSVSTINPRDFTTDNYHSVDDEPFGGGSGMVFTPLPLYKAIQKSKKSTPGPVVFLTPAGTPLTHARVVSLSKLDGITLLCGRYEGIDQRIVDLFVDEEISIGDYVLSGGEPAAIVLMDAIARQCSGVVKEAASVENDSFFDGLLDHPHYTRPAEFNRKKVPQVLLSGDHKRIQKWRMKMKLVETLTKRPDLLLTARLSPEQKKMLTEIREELRKGSPADK
ncbi:MAG: tRNA (guanosine(37)-N1)-methyltransferase TrmD [Acidobacteria bacterium]|nr:tRNA (guanosine(37)-N1)-methyltransferase TrmD [Acidobacteriota bacterium]